MSEFLQLLEELEKDIFEFRIDAAMQKVATLTEKVIAFSGKMDEALLPEFMDIINHVNYALTSKDYLFLMDLLQFELIPFMESLPLPQREYENE